jgi:hypothetical protein
MTAIANPVRGSLASNPMKRFERLYVVLLGSALVCYLLLGKAFAYLGVPPVYVGELLIVLGVLAAAQSRCLPASMASLPSLMLFLLMAWVAVLTFHNLAEFGFDSLRDSVVVTYGVFAFIVTSLLIADPSRLEWIVRSYRYVSVLIVTAAPLALMMSSASMEALREAMNVPPFVRTGELAVHLAGATAFTLLGFRKQGWIWSLFLLMAVALVFAQNRGGALAIAISAGVAVILSGNARGVCQFIFIGGALALIAAIANVNISLGGERDFHFDQIIANLSSIWSDSDTGNLDGTKEWRLSWWTAIVQYTLQGDYFWTGKGFGPNLAVVDGFLVGTEFDAPLVRSPHNAHLTILARAGVPGLVLWVLFLVAWFGTLARNAWVAWLSGEGSWARFFVFVACYALAILVDAAFDVALEGPMLGIWFWVLIGVGMGSSMIFWSRHPERSAYGV